MTGEYTITRMVKRIVSQKFNLKKVFRRRTSLPSLADQKRIVASLDEEQQIIEANKRLVEMMKGKIEGVMGNLLCR
jgi:hypothetical protein